MAGFSRKFPQETKKGGKRKATCVRESSSKRDAVIISIFFSEEKYIRIIMSYHGLMHLAWVMQIHYSLLARIPPTRKKGNRHHFYIFLFTLLTGGIDTFVPPPPRISYKNNNKREREKRRKSSLKKTIYFCFAKHFTIVSFVVFFPFHGVLFYIRFCFTIKTTFFIRTFSRRLPGHAYTHIHTNQHILRGRPMNIFFLGYSLRDIKTNSFASLLCHITACGFYEERVVLGEEFKKKIFIVVRFFWNNFNNFLFYHFLGPPTYYAMQNQVPAVVMVDLVHQLKNRMARSKKKTFRNHKLTTWR